MIISVIVIINFAYPMFIYQCIKRLAGYNDNERRKCQLLEKENKRIKSKFLQENKQLKREIDELTPYNKFINYSKFQMSTMVRNEFKVTKLDSYLINEIFRYLYQSEFNLNLADKENNFEAMDVWLANIRVDKEVEFNEYGGEFLRICYMRHLEDEKSWLLQLRSNIKFVLPQITLHDVEYRFGDNYYEGKILDQYCHIKLKLRNFEDWEILNNISYHLKELCGFENYPLIVRSPQTRVWHYLKIYTSRDKGFESNFKVKFIGSVTFELEKICITPSIPVVKFNLISAIPHSITE